jgi:hypothetical protein
VFDRNSYDLLRLPIANSGAQPEMAKLLRGKWGTDLVDMLTLKVLPQLGRVHRVVTRGTVSDLTLRDEEFIEIQKVGSFGPADVEEVRLPSEEAARREAMVSRYLRGDLPSVVDLTWCARMRAAERRLNKAGLPLTIITGHHRTGRWS